jgi:hypothetical protein
MKIDMDLRFCHEADPIMWATFCEVSRRLGTPSDIWTVYDVEQWFARKRQDWLDEYGWLPEYPEYISK